MERYDALERLLPHERVGRRVLSVGLTTTADGRLLAMSESTSDQGGHERRLHGSDAAGNRWTTLGTWRFGDRDRPGVRGALPAMHETSGHNGTRVWAARDRLFTLGELGYDGIGRVYCSRDGGRSWRLSC
jgi:hypothetical protein